MDMERNVYLSLMDPDKALKIWLDRIGKLDSQPGEENIPLEQSHGRIIAQAVEAKRSSPAFHGAAMDGVAVRAEQTFGASPRQPVKLEIDKDAFWINTGKPLPDGCNAVIMVENINLDEDGKIAVIEKAAFPWQHVRKTGEDIVATEIIAPAGTRIGAYEMGALAAGGAMTLPVFRKPKVAIIPTGSEIFSLDNLNQEELNSGKKLPEFNSLIFSAMVREAGGDPIVLPITPDEPDAIKRSIQGAVEEGADLIILNAGASAGTHDFSPHVIKECGELLCHGIAMMPGKPASLGIVSNGNREVPILGAPGYPVSATMVFEEFAQPLLAFWQKMPAPCRRRVEVEPVNPLPSRAGMEERVRVRLGIVDGQCFAAPLSRGAGTVTSLSRADAIITIPKNCEGISAGNKIQADLLRPLEMIEGALMCIGSHDNALDIIDSFLRRAYPDFRLTSAHVGSMGGLRALAKGQCHIAGSHLLDINTGIYNLAAIRENLKDLPVTLIRLADREQGLILQPGNPLGIESFKDLIKPGVTFINRQRGSGTRVLLDYELLKAGLDGKKIAGYADEEYTHMNVAVAVASGRAHVGLGARAAANALGLDFDPVAMEEYDLVIPQKYLDDERIKALLAIVRSESFKKALQDMGGYDLKKTGEVIWQSWSELT